jgi:hypothetical protein
MRLGKLNGARSPTFSGSGIGVGVGGNGVSVGASVAVGSGILVAVSCGGSVGDRVAVTTTVSLGQQADRSRLNRITKENNVRFNVFLLVAFAVEKRWSVLISQIHP